MSEVRRLASLLEIARHTLRHTLVPGLAGTRKFEAAMIANALAVAARSVERGEAAAERERAALCRLYGIPESAPGEAGGLTPLRRRLAADIRDGRFDTAEPSLLQAALHARTAGRLSLTDPSRGTVPDRR